MDARLTDGDRARSSVRGRGREILLGEPIPAESPPPAPRADAPRAEPELESRRAQLDPSALPLSADETAALLDFSSTSPAYRLDAPFPPPALPGAASASQSFEPNEIGAPRIDGRVLGRTPPVRSSAPVNELAPWLREVRAPAVPIEADAEAPDEGRVGAGTVTDHASGAGRPDWENLEPGATAVWTTAEDDAGVAPPLAGWAVAPDADDAPRAERAPEARAQIAEPAADAADTRAGAPVSAIVTRPTQVLLDPVASSRDDLLDLLVDDERIRKLARQIEALQEELANRPDGARANSELYLEDLAQASRLLRTSRANYDDARSIVCRVRADLTRQRRVDADIRLYRPRLLVYFLLWIIVIVGLFALKDQVARAADTLGVGAISALYYPLLFGAGGALIAGFLALDRHTTRLRDFDPVHVSWYLVNPLLGAVIGQLMFVLAALANEDLLREQAATAEYAITYLLCVVAGMNQSHILRRLENLLKRLGRAN